MDNKYIVIQEELKDMLSEFKYLLSGFSLNDFERRVIEHSNDLEEMRWVLWLWTNLV